MPDRREFLTLAFATALAGPRATKAAATPALALVTADTEAHIAVVSLHRRKVIGRVHTVEGPRSIQATRNRQAVVAHADAGVVTILEGRPPSVRRVLRGFGQPRYTAVSPDHRYAYVSDGSHGEVAVIDLRIAKVIHRAPVGDGARHLTIAPDGHALWVALGSSAQRIAVLDLRNPKRPHRTRTIAPPFLAHDVGFSPSGRYVWVTAGRERTLAIYDARTRRIVRDRIAADAAPQHVSFGPTLAYIASGEAGTVTAHALSDQRVTRRTRTPRGSYNVQRAAGVVLTPSLGTGDLTILDRHGRRQHTIRVARHAHDAAVIS